MTSGRFQLTEPETEEAMMAELQRTAPRELLFPEDFEPVHLMSNRNGNRRRPVWEFELDTAKQQLNQQFGTRDLVGFGVEHASLGFECRRLFDPIRKRHTTHCSTTYPLTNV